MEFITDPALIRALAPMPALIDAIADAFRDSCTAPPRAIITAPGAAGLLVSMPAFDSSGTCAVKLATLYSANLSAGLPTVQGIIVLFSGHGTPEAVLDGTSVTKLRTGAASALASRYLSRENSSHLLVIGTGALAPIMALAHCVVRPIKRISIWGRTTERAVGALNVIKSLVRDIEVSVVESVDMAVQTADIITCATSSPTPVLPGRLLQPGTFVDLVGSFSPQTREADDEVVVRSRIFVDTREGALCEAGDLLDPLERGVIKREHIVGTLSELVLGRVKGRADPDEITLFKSVGSAIEDLAAAKLILENKRRNPHS